MTEKKWHEDDSFWETFEPTLFGEKLIAQTPDEVEKIIKLVKLEPDAKILDLCCGIGRHCLEFAKRSFTITGVDRTAKYLDEARQAAAEKNLEIDFLLDDARTYRQPDTFDFVLSMLTSFGYFEDPADDEKVLRNIFDSLKNQGCVLIDVMGKESLAHFFQERDWHQEHDALLLSERKIIDNWSAILNRWILIKDNQRFEKEFSLRIYSAYELTELLKKCGFSNVTAYSDLDGSPYRLHAKRLITVAQKIL